METNAQSVKKDGSEPTEHFQSSYSHFEEKSYISIAVSEISCEEESVFHDNVQCKDMGST